MSGAVDHVLELMAEFGPVTTRKMFGAIALYHAGLIFGMVDDDVLYLKGDDVLKPEFEKENLSQFTYESKSGGRTAMSYWRAPERCLDDGDEMKLWCGKAYQAALRSQKPKTKAKKSKSS
jgi:DNA transformation protein and related proteins